MRLPVLWCAVLHLAAAIPSNLLYDHNLEETRKLQRGSDVSSREVPLVVPIVFFGGHFDSIYVNSNGLLSFQTEIGQFINIEFPLDYPLIAPFYSHVDSTIAGTIYYHETSEPGSLQRATKNVQDTFTDAQDFQAQALFVATWHAVGYFREGSDKLNTYQVAIASDGDRSYVEFLYPENGLQWIQGNADESGLPDARAQAGIISPDGKVFTLPGSGTEQVKNLELWSNMGLPGQFIYRVDGFEVVQPDINNQDSVIQSPSTCAGASTACHIQATCQDYDEGFCCKCKDKYFGNGKNCIKKDQPLRANGKITGRINGHDLGDLDLQSYIVVTDGRAYTAMSKIPQQIGFDIQSLQLLGGSIGYLFAKPLRGALNGYQLTGGVFNHTATIKFENTSQVVNIKQKFLGLDVFDQLRLESQIDGDIPKLPNDVRIQIDEYQEEYTLTSPGLLQMSSTRNFKYINALNNEQVVYYYTVEQSIKFDYCKFENASVGTIWKLRVGKNYITYEAREQIVRYALSNKIVPYNDADPCDEGRTTCGPNSSCVVVDSDQFRCVCNPGYQEFQRGHETLCADIDECVTGRNDCDYNADCANLVGGYSCTCKPGFEGDGQVCENAKSCDRVRCLENAECIAQNEVAQCVCMSGFIGDGQRCDPVVSHSCHDANNCSPYGICAIDPESNRYFCQCLPDYEGNGYVCTPRERTTGPDGDFGTTVPSREIQRCLLGVCWCPEGYKIEPNSKYCLSLDEQQAANNTQDNFSDTCDTLNNCHKEAKCVFLESLQNYTCQCNPGLEGDGFNTCESSSYQEQQQSCSVLDNCDEQATCTYQDSIGKSVCVCNPGYAGDGYRCSILARCSSDSECTNTEECLLSPSSGQYECVCKENHHRDSQHQCIPAHNLCGNGKCVDNAECLYDNEVQAHYCSCKPDYIGDGITECTQKPVGCDRANNCAERAQCLYSQDAQLYQCKCNEGYQGDGLVCEPERTCQNDPSLCDPQASCQPSAENRYVCRCNQGFLGNGTRCVSDGRHDGNFLLLNYGIATLRVNLEPHAKMEKPIQIKFNQVSVGLDIDCQEGRVYWSDINQRAIRSSNYRGEQKQDFISAGMGSPEGLAIDWISRNLYWTDSTNDTIEVVNLDSKRRRTLFNTGIGNPRGIAVHPQRGKIFWTDWNRAQPKIEWANADGSQREIFLQSPDVILPNSLTIDYETESLCFADAGTKKIECVNLDSRAKQTIAVNATYPFGITVTDQTVYWSDWVSKKIERVDKYSLKRDKPISVQVFGSGGRLYALVAVPRRCPSLTSACQYQQCPEEHICLPRGRSGATCACAYKADQLDESPTCLL